MRTTGRAAVPLVGGRAGDAPRGMRGWAVVVPVKGAPQGKSRLDLPDRLRAELAIAFALDTVRAVTGTGSVREVVVVGGGDAVPRFRALGARVVPDPGAGLIPALQRGLAAVGDGRLGRALLLGDLPALTSAELEDVLRAAARLPRALLPDDGSGTVLATARPGVRHRPQFGPGSRAAHRRAGYVELTVPVTWGIRRDVDTVEDLRVARRRRVGRATAAALRTRGRGA